jgi:N-acetylglucosaminyldiphosphoundecaprenol N-acetyl-beta-D-mannosaminyltransferase
MNTKINRIFDIPVNSFSMKETIEYIQQRIKANDFTQHVVINAGKIVDMQKNPLLKQSVLEADMINADGMSVVWASHLLGEPLPERVAGIDLMLNLLKLAHQNDYKCYFLGATEEVVKKVVEIFSDIYSPSIIAGFRNGYFSPNEEELIAKNISSSGTKILFVAMSSPKKEIFVNKYKNILKVPFIMGVGGSFDVIAGITKRAPLWMQRSGFEWFFRLIQEPKRMWRRYLIGNIKFIQLVIRELIHINNKSKQIYQ